MSKHQGGEGQEVSLKTTTQKTPTKANKLSLKTEPTHRYVVSGHLSVSLERAEIFPEDKPVATDSYLIDKKGRVFGPSVIAILIPNEEEKIMRVSPLKTELILKLLRIVPEDKHEDQKEAKKEHKKLPSNKNASTKSK